MLYWNIDIVSFFYIYCLIFLFINFIIHTVKGVSSPLISSHFPFPTDKLPFSPPDKDPSPSPPDKGGKGGLNNLIILYSVSYVNILIYNSYKIINYILYIIITV